MTVGPLAAHQLPMPAKKRGRFHNPDHFAHRFDGAPCPGFQFGRQDHQRQLLASG